MDRKIVEYFRSGLTTSKITKQTEKGKGYVIGIRKLALEYNSIDVASEKPTTY